MKALVLANPKEPLTHQDEPEPIPAKGEVLVSLKAAALNRRDFWITQGMYPGVKTPCILGSDGAGTTSDGREVILNPGIDWGSDEAAQSTDFRILGMPDNGTFAEHVAIQEALVHDKPAHLSWTEAAALPLAGVTAYRAMFVQGGLESGQSVLITGVGGGVGSLSLQFAVAAGAQVTVTSSSETKLAKAKELGASFGVNYGEEGWAKAIQDHVGSIDLVIDSAGGGSYNHLLKLLKPGGRIVNFGATAGPPAELDMFSLFWKQLQIVGSTMGSPRDFSAMLDFVNQHQITPGIDRVRPLSEGGEAVQSMAKMEQFGQQVLEIA